MQELNEYRLLRLLIKGSELSPDEVAEKAGITKLHLLRLCSGQIGISVATAQKLAEVLGLIEEVLYVGVYLENLEIERRAAEAEYSKD